MIDQFPLHWIPLFPLLGAAINLLIGRRLGRTLAALIGCGAVAAAMLLGWEATWQLGHAAPSATFTGALFRGTWIHASDGNYSLHLNAGLMLDRLSAVMVLVITSVGFLIHLYSIAYMEADAHFSRYFGYLNLFTGAMLILVLGDSLPVTFIGWEGVGLCSYLLIGFWFDKEQNASAGRKAFIVNRIGDFGFVLGMLLIFAATSTLQYSDLSSAPALAQLRRPLAIPGASYATFAALLLFIGATGKSAQLPLYVWLPDAMAGPTPVSALIHAATMVTAGVYMVARLHGVIEIDPFASGVIASVGAATALLAATIGVAQKPIKKILAYSTVSQLGFMFIGVGTRAYTAGMFHLVTHALFKAGLFLGAGSIMHALGGLEDVTQMGGLKRKLPITRWTFLIYCLAIAGIFPFSGFFSKDAILASAFGFDFPELAIWPHWLGHAIYAAGVTAALLTAFYMFRAYFLVFGGEFRGPPEVHAHAHESPTAMTIPLVVLAVGAAGAGLLGVPEIFHPEMNHFEEWLSPALFAPTLLHHSAALEWGLMGLATAVALVGISLAWWLYGRGPAPAVATLAARLRPLHRLVENRYYLDEVYDLLIVRPLRAVAYVFWKVIDALLIDLVLVRGLALVVDLFGRMIRYVQNGDAQRYVVGVVLGIAVFAGLGANWVAWRAAPFEVEMHGAEVTVRAHGAPVGAETRPLKYQFDFGDGTIVKLPERAVPIASHHYQGNGTRRITVTAYDPRWGTHSRESRLVEVRTR